MHHWWISSFSLLLLLLLHAFRSDDFFLVDIIGGYHLFLSQ